VGREAELAAQRRTVIGRCYLVQNRITDEGTPYACLCIEWFLKGKNRQDTIHTALDPSHPSPAPGPQLRRNVVQHLEAAGFGHPGEMEIQAGIIDQDHKIPALPLDQLSDSGHPL